MKLLKLLFLFIYMPAAQLTAQYPFSKKIAIEEENLTLKANAIIKDQNGFLWIGTSAGLFKYASTVPEIITTSEIDKCHVTALYEDAEGTIWAGCRDGRILKVKKHKISWFTPPESLPKMAVTAIKQDAKKRMWFATGGEGLYCYANDHLYHITEEDGLSADYVNCIYPLTDNEIIAGTDRGLSFIKFEYGKKNIKIFTTKNGLPDNIVSCITESHTKNMVWVGTQSKGMLLFNIKDKGIQEISTKNTGWRYGQINDILEVNNIAFIATEQNGIISFNQAKHTTNEKVLTDSLFPKRIADLQTDNEGNIWAAAENKLISFTGEYLTYWHAAKGINFIKVHTVLADDEGKLWFTPDFRLYENTKVDSDKVSLRSYDITPPKDHIDITGLYKDRFGFLWIGTMGEGLFRMNLETGKWRRIAENPIAYYGNILSIAGKDNQVWISTLNGVSRFNLTENNYELNTGIAFTNYSKRDGLGSDYIYHILIDKQNRVWFATDGAGVAVFQNNLFTNFYTAGRFPASVTYSLAEDKNQHIWISTYNEGLFKYDGKIFTRYGIKNGLTDLAISSIAVDEFNNVIAVNKKGIDILNPVKNIVQHYGPESGFYEPQPNLNSISKAPDGKIWIGTDNGIVCLNTSSAAVTYRPVAVIEYVNLFNNPIDTAGRKNFAYDQNNFSFKLAAAFYKAPEKIKFQYWLEGYNKDWETTGDRVINFPRLRPGRYLLKVRASATNNFDAAPIAAYRFSISRKFWTTWWFYLLSFLVISALLYWIVMQRIKSIKKTQQYEYEKFQLQYDALKNQINPHFLFNSFNALLNFVEDDPKEAAILIKHLSLFYRKLTAYSQKEMITLEEELELLDSYLFIQKKRYGSALQVSININTDFRKSCWIPPLVLQLLTENAVKHNTISKDRPLHIEIFTAQYRIVVQNNINPKLEKEESEGVGLKNINNRYRFLTDIEVTQEENNGVFTVKLPIIYN
ncbi:MAG: histidine kinase [Chitinophagaceae bacterium]|nr:histidine kinase [Chitinophagaceae bacterium]